jgi:hypothetical protein
MPLTTQCNVCKIILLDGEIEVSKEKNLPALCFKHLSELEIKLKKWIPLFKKMNLS